MAVYASFFISFWRQNCTKGRCRLRGSGITIALQNTNKSYLSQRIASFIALQHFLKGAGVNILAWNHKLFPKGIFQDKKLFPRIYFPNLIIALHLQEIAFITPFNVWKRASLQAKVVQFLLLFPKPSCLIASF